MEDGTPYPYYCGPVDNGYKLKITGENMAQQTAVSKMETTQTAVEWLKSQMENMVDGYFGSPWVEIFKQAKAMEREQIKDAYWNGTVDMEKSDALIEAEYFYNETYNK